MKFAERFKSTYYKKRYAKASVTFNNKRLSHIATCPDNEKQYIYCKKELTKEGYNIKNYDILPDYYTKTNGSYPFEKPVYFWDIRKIVDKDLQKDIEEAKLLSEDL